MIYPTWNNNDIARPRALIVDDDAATRGIHRRLLTSCGCESDEAVDGREAIEAVSTAQARGEPFDLILMDVQMPVVNGWAAASTVRHNGYGGKLVIVSGSSDLDTPGRCASCGVDEFLLKSATPLALMAAINLWLTIPRGRQRTDLFGSALGPASRLALIN